MIVIVISVQPEVCRSRISCCHSLRRLYSPEMGDHTVFLFRFESLCGNQEAVAIETEREKRERERKRHIRQEWESIGHTACVMC